jgi:hypothetical protein
MRHYLGVAEQEGITSVEVDTIQAIVMSVSACRVRSQLAEISGRPR